MIGTGVGGHRHSSPTDQPRAGQPRGGAAPGWGQWEQGGGNQGGGDRTIITAIVRIIIRRPPLSRVPERKVFPKNAMFPERLSRGCTRGTFCSAQERLTVFDTRATHFPEFRISLESPKGKWIRKGFSEVAQGGSPNSRKGIFQKFSRISPGSHASSIFQCSQENSTSSDSGPP